jgi:hypothetical protein
MFIFYDFETSQRHFLGQILSYYFVVVDRQYRIIRECEGLIKPNRMECPSCEAIAVNQLSIHDCVTRGIREYDAAQRIFDFIDDAITTHGPMPLTGFNSARFDFKHFEKLLLKNGISPSFYGKVSSLDVYQFAKYCALSHPETFPFTRKKTHDITSFGFRLEELCRAFDCLDTPQTHDAKDDVHLTIALTKALESRFSQTLSDFHARQLNTQSFCTPNTYLREPFFRYEQTADTPIVDTNQWLVIGQPSKTAFLLLNSRDYTEKKPTNVADHAPLIRYLNTRTTYIHVSVHPQTDAHSAILADPHIRTITAKARDYFLLFPVSWDIEYRPWAMGFDRIDTLRACIQRLIQDPNAHAAIIAEWRNRQPHLSAEAARRDRLMITLFNRFYLNHHRNPLPRHAQQYIQSRYVSGTMFQNPDDRTNLDTELATIELKRSQVPKSSREYRIFSELYDYTAQFIATYLAGQHI